VSKDEAKQMFFKIDADEKLLNNFNELIRQNQNEPETVIADKLIEFGKNAGFIFSKEELLAAHSELMDKAMADNDLAAVAGGLANQTTQLIDILLKKRKH